MPSFMPDFDQQYSRLLGRRRDTFRRLFELLEYKRQSAYTIVETGCAHVGLPDRLAWAFHVSGHSTLLFDHFLNVHGGTLYSIDISPRACRLARLATSKKTRIICCDSLSVLPDFQPEAPVDCLYLDSMNIDWHAPHPSALHHLRELCAILPKLPSDCIVCVDDNSSGTGKAGYIRDVMDRLGAELLFEDYQIGWRLRQVRPSRPLGEINQVEKNFINQFQLPRIYRYLRMGHDERMLELLPHGEIGQGRGPGEERWFIQEQDTGELELILAGRGRVTCRLREIETGKWCGAWLLNTHVVTELHPVAHPQVVFPLSAKPPVAGWYRLFRGVLPPRLLELKPTGDVGWGRSHDFETWALQDEGEAPVRLDLRARGQHTAHLQRQAATLWTGQMANDATAPEPISLVRQPPPPETALHVATDLSRGHMYLYGAPRSDERFIQFLPGGAIGIGRTAAECGWAIDLTPGGEIELLLFGPEGPSSRLVHIGTRRWRGWRQNAARSPLGLEKVDLGSYLYLTPYFSAWLPRSQVQRILELGTLEGRDTLALQHFFDAEVVTFECNPTTLPTARRRLVGVSRITLVPCAVAAADGPTPFYCIRRGNRYASSLSPPTGLYPYEYYHPRQVTVPAVRLDRWCANHGIDRVDLLCMTAQAGGLTALHSMGELLGSVQYIIARLQTRPIYHDCALADEVTSFLVAQGFHLLRSINQWGVLADGSQLRERRFPQEYAALASWFGDYLFVRLAGQAALEAARRTVPGHYRYKRLGYDERALELCPDGTIGAGVAGNELNWTVRQVSDGGAQLWLLGQEGLTGSLEHTASGRWEGHSHIAERMPICLEPLVRGADFSTGRAA